MSSSLQKLISAQVSAAADGSISFDELNEFLAPIVWEVDGLDDEESQELLYAVELALSEYSIGHMNDRELKDELRSLVVYDDIKTATCGTTFASRVMWLSTVDNGHGMVAG